MTTESGVARALDEPARPPTILVADDETDLRELVAYRLTRAGYRVVEARDGEEALRLALAQPPELVVSDVMMPKLDGYDLTRRLRAEEATRRLPVILLTSRAQEADVARALDAGADGYLTKPFNPEELLAVVRAILGRR
jgi:DNA-binding response OmpR family regulator